MDIRKIQAAIAACGADGWLFFDFHNRDHIGYKVLGLDFAKHCSRRWYYFVPVKGAPRKLVHAIEKQYLAQLPGGTSTYASRESLIAGLKTLLGGAKTAAMQYSPLNNMPTISLADAGTVELVRSLGTEPVTSAGLVQRLYSLLDDEGLESHIRAGKQVLKIKDAAFAFAFDRVRSKKAVTELEVQGFILEAFDKAGLTPGHGRPIVGVNAHAADPHFEPTKANTVRIKPGDKLLIDLWAQGKRPGSIFYDVTWCGYVGAKPPADYVKRFAIVCKARDAALSFIRERVESGKPVMGMEADRACRAVIENAGFGQYFPHRTGHSIDTSVHGEGANLDSLETEDNRELLPGALFSIEPGIYRGNMGVRSEINGYIGHDKKVHVFGAIQQNLICMA